MNKIFVENKKPTIAEQKVFLHCRMEILIRKLRQAFAT